MHEFSKKTEIYLHNTKKVRTFALAFENNLSKQLKNNPNSIEYNIFKYIYRGVEQLVARQAHNLEVTRSSRVSATNHKVCRLTHFFSFYTPFVLIVKQLMAITIKKTKKPPC